MDKVSYFKNFPMGTEIDIAGTFIYNGIKAFNSLDTFYYESEIFHVLYPISIGIERLQKVLIVLLEDSVIDEIFEKKLITHSHQHLHKIIKTKCNIHLTSQQNGFLNLISEFYNSCRYDRFNVNGKFTKERDLFIKFISSHLGIDIVFDDYKGYTKNNEKIKQFIGRIVGAISKTYYDEIRSNARKLNLYTHELRCDSPAYKIFLPEFKKNSLQELITNEQIALKEILIYLINTKDKSDILEYIKKIKPLNLDAANISDYINAIINEKISMSIIDEVEAEYDEINNYVGRLDLIEIIGAENFYFFNEINELYEKDE